MTSYARRNGGVGNVALRLRDLAREVEEDAEDREARFAAHVGALEDDIRALERQKADLQVLTTHLRKERDLARAEAAELQRALDDAEEAHGAQREATTRDADLVTQLTRELIQARFLLAQAVGDARTDSSAPLWAASVKENHPPDRRLSGGRSSVEEPPGKALSVALSAELRKAAFSQEALLAAAREGDVDALDEALRPMPVLTERDSAEAAPRDIDAFLSRGLVDLLTHLSTCDGPPDDRAAAVCRRMVKLGASLDDAGGRANDPGGPADAPILHQLVLAGAGEGVVVLALEAGARFATADGRGRTPLHVAVEGRNAKAVEALLRQGVCASDALLGARLPRPV